MAVGVVLEFDGASIDQYDQVIEKMGLTPGGDTPAGALFHWVTATDGGIRVTDVWSPASSSNASPRSRSGPIGQEAGIQDPPRVTFYEVHNYLSAT